MTLRYRVNHQTRYEYNAEVVYARHWLHLRPREHEHQHVISHGLLVDPAPAETLTLTDAFGNDTLQLAMERPHRYLEVTVDMEVAIKSRSDLNAADSLPWERVRDELSYTSRPRSARELEALSHRLESPLVHLKNAYSEFAAPCFGKTEPVLVGAERLMRKLFEHVTYMPGKTHTHTPAMEVLEKRHGVCQDYSHLMIACMRALGLSARYVSGYLRTIPLQGVAALTGADASHAWVAVYAPPFGWVDLDPTNNVRVSTDHITLAWGRDFSDVSPLRGVITGGGSHQVSVAVSVVPLANESH
jgi:transglutaminase-like putative cysteine protease